MKKSITGYVFESKANLDHLLYKDEYHIRLDGVKIQVRKNQYKKTYKELGADHEELVKVKVTVEILK